MKKPWLALPFLGASETTSPQPSRNRNSQVRSNGKSGDPVDISRQQTIASFASKREEDIVADYNSPIHMWVVATLFPLIAGTFGPMASMFNICAIAIDWRVVVNPASVSYLPNSIQYLLLHTCLTPQQPQSNGRKISDPSWLVAINIVSLVIAIIANISLLGQMTNRLRYNISGPVTIVGFCISGWVDVGLVAAASQHLPLPDDPNATYSQAFYYATFAGAIYVILSMMLSVTAWGIWFGQYSNEFKLSLSQRSLMIQTIFFLAYVLCTGGVYQVVEDWTFLDSTYFAVVTLFTIGFGYPAPKTHLGRSLFFPMAIGGIIFVGVIIANIRTLVVENGSVKVSTRLVEKARYRAILKGKPEEGILRMRGLVRRHTNAATEHGRRENEFNAMRDIQKEAAQNDRLFALTFSLVAFMILWFIGAVIFWQAESQSVGGQNWTYFQALYFTFVSQLTIGYGDFSPQTNSSKPAFVFWALIALPTLTVLIGSIGDVVSTFVGWYTVWLGRNAHDFWQLVGALIKRKAKEEIRHAIRELKDIEQVNPDVEGAGFQHISAIERRRTVPLHVDTDSLTALQIELAEEKYRPFIMLRAAQKILEHLDETPPRKYTYEEWTWLLKLLGEDETTPDGHRRVGTPVNDGDEIGPPQFGKKGSVWSWLGQESPLMSLEEDTEPKWVLKRLMTGLEMDLKGRAERHVRRDIGEICAEGNEVEAEDVQAKDFGKKEQ